MKRILPVIIAVLINLICGLSTFANDDKDDPSKINSHPIAKTKSYSKYRTFAPAQNLVSKQILASVEHQIESLEQMNFNVNFSPSAAFLADMPVNATVVSDRDKAKAAIDDAIKRGYMLDGDVQNAPPLQPVKLPLGIKKHFGQNNIVYLAFSKAVIKPTHAEITAFVKMEMFVEDGQTGTKKKREIFFGADGIKQTKTGSPAYLWLTRTEDPDETARSFWLICPY